MIAAVMISLVTVGCRDAQRDTVPPGASAPAPTDQATDEPTDKAKFETAPAPAAPARDTGDDQLFTDISDRIGMALVFHSGRQAGEYAIIESLGGGVAALDYDLDGRIDLMFAGGGDLENRHCSGRPSTLIRNLGPWAFEQVTTAAGCQADRFYNHGVFPGDFDGDGFPDLAISGFGGVQIYRNQGDGTFRRLDDWVSHPDHPWSTSLAWADFNANGLLDCYVTHYVDWSWENHPRCSGGPGVPREVCPPRQFAGVTDAIYFNNGRGGFQRSDREAGLVAGGKGLGVVAGDINLNGATDIYVGNDTTDNFLYWNDGQGHFTEAAILAGVSGDPAGVNTGSMGVALADVDGDGLPDIWVTNFERELFALYRNERQGLFSHVSRAAGIGAVEGLYVGFGTVLIDPHGDARPDIFVANGHVSYHSPRTPFRQRPLWLANQSDGRFAQPPPRGYFAEPHSGRGLIHVDLENDGGWDLVFTHLEEPPTVLQGKPPAHDHWALVQLVGRQANREAIGATVRVSGPEGEHLYLVCGGGSYLSQSDRRLRIVAPGDPRAVDVHVRWPAGQEETFAFPDPGSGVVWVQGEATASR